MCGACEREKSSTMVQMYGQPYNQNTLKPVPPDEQARLNRVSNNLQGSRFNLESPDIILTP